MSLKNLFHKEARGKEAAAACGTACGAGDKRPRSSPPPAARLAALGTSTPRNSPPPAAQLAALGTSSPRKSLPPAARLAALGISKL